LPKRLSFGDLRIAMIPKRMWVIKSCSLAVDDRTD
jgi:hypothetical protein